MKRNMLFFWNILLILGEILKISKTVGIYQIILAKRSSFGYDFLTTGRNG